MTFVMVARMPLIMSVADRIVVLSFGKDRKCAGWCGRGNRRLSRGWACLKWVPRHGNLDVLHDRPDRERHGFIRLLAQTTPADH
jgi:hypothetical protein